MYVPLKRLIVPYLKYFCALGCYINYLLLMLRLLLLVYMNNEKCWQINCTIFNMTKAFILFFIQHHRLLNV
jgi:hypothetical protein